MNRLAGLVICVLCVVVAFAIWRPRPNKPAIVSVGAINAPNSSATPDLSAPEKRYVSSSPEKPLIFQQDGQTALHLKLREWMSARASDSEEDLDRLMKELSSLLTDDNAAEIVQSLSAEERGTPFSLVALHRWMRMDPAKASDWTASRPEESGNLLTSAVAEDWANHKEAFRSYVDQMPSNDWKETILAATGLELSMKDPQGAIELAQRMQPGAPQTNLMQAVVCDWIALEPNAALNWILDVNQPELREQLTAAAAKSYALKEPRLAASWLISTVRSPELMKESVLTIVETWGASDPEKAAKWAAAALYGETRKAAIRIISDHWMKSNREAADAWLQSLSHQGT